MIDKTVANIYVILSVTTIILFLLTRKIHIRIKKFDNFVFSIEYILFGLEITKSEQGAKNDNDDLEEGGNNTSTNELFSLLSPPLKYSSKSIITLKRLNIPWQTPNSDIFSAITFTSILSSAIAYVESKVEKLIIVNNAFTLDPDRGFLLDLDVGISLFNLLILAIQVILKGTKLGKMENADVGN